MGTHHGGDGGNVPPDGGIPPDGDQPPDDPIDLPPFPPEWGDVIIPDDASELAAEADQVRKELAEQRYGLGPRHRPESATGPDVETEPSIGVPLLIMSVAVLITLVSLFAMAWSGAGNTERAGPGPDAEPVEELPAISLPDAVGRPVPLAGYLPAAILLVEACDDCASLVAATVAAAPAGVTVLAVGSSVPERPPGLEAGAALQLLADRDATLRTELNLGAPTNAATVVLVDLDRRVTVTVPAATAVGQFHGDLIDLTA